MRNHLRFVSLLLAGLLTVPVGSAVGAVDDQGGSRPFGGEIVQVDTLLVICELTVDFEELTIGNKDNIISSPPPSFPVQFGERFVGQSVAPSGDFDDVTGNPSNPLTLMVGAPNQNLTVVDDPIGGSLALAGNSAASGGHPALNAIGEGSIAMLFDRDQCEVEFRPLINGGGPVTVTFYRRDGTMIATETLTVNKLHAFQRAGLPPAVDIAGILVENGDTQGISIDDVCLTKFDPCNPIVTLEGCDTFLLPAQAAPIFPVTRDGDSVKVNIVFEDVGDFCDLSNFRAWGLEVVFDDTKLALVGCRRGAFSDAPSWPSFSCQQIGVTNQVKIQANVGQTGPHDPGAGPVELATLCFLPLNTPVVETYNFSTLNFTDDFGTETLFLQLNIQPDAYAVTTELHGTGDVTLNGFLTAGDAQCAAETNFDLGGEGFDVVPAQCISSTPPPPNECNTAPLERYEADTNCDGVVGLLDADKIFDAASCGLGVIPPTPCLFGAFAACPAPAKAGILVRAAYVPTNKDREVRLGDVRISGSDVLRIPLQIQGTGQLKAFTLDFSYPSGLEIIEVERATETAGWLGLGHGTPAPGSLRVLGYDIRPLTLHEDEWITLAYLVVRAVTEEASTGRFELVASWDDVDGVPLAGGDVAIFGTSTEGLPTEFALGVGRPNPSRGDVAIEFNIPAGPSRAVEMAIYNVHGQLVRTLLDAPQVPGHHVVTWDGRDQVGRQVASGAYFYRMKSGAFQQTRKIVQSR